MFTRIVLVWVLAIVARLAYLQIWKHEYFVDRAQAQQWRPLEVQGARGTIVDRTGLPLAKSLPVDSVCVNPLRVRDVGVASEMLAKILKLDAAEIAAEIQATAARKKGFLWIKRRVSQEESTKLRSLNLDWIEFRTESRRFYPNGELAAHVVGSVNHKEHGNSGVEQSLDKDLAGSVAELRLLTDSQNTAYADEGESRPLPGMDIMLTIDSRIQNVAERELLKAVIKSKAKSGSLVAMDPRTGEVLALANWPTFNPNDAPSPQNPSAGRNNFAITSPYEPGSIFKVMTVAAALETTRLRPESMISCAPVRIGKRVIHESHAGYFGTLSMADVLARSSNLGAINIGMTVGIPNMFEYMHKLGFGAPTGVELPAEHGGKIRAIEKWRKTSLASVSMGHEVMVTAVQLAQLGTIIANGGMLVHPKLVIRRQRAGEAAVPEVSTRPVRVLRPETAILMRRMMEGVVLHGTAQGKANIKGYTVGGKTGTAQIYNFEKHQYTHFYNSSFLGFAPVANPAIVVVVTLTGTQGSGGYGAQVAAPVFREVAASGLRLLDVPKDIYEDVPEKEDRRVTADDLPIAGLDLEAGDELAAEAAGAARESSGQALTQLADGRILGPLVPDFLGKTMRDVLEEASSSGTPVEFSGRGVVRAQMPPPGGVLPGGDKVRIYLGR